MNVAMRFIKIAADELPHSIFQRIYGLSMTDKEKSETNIEEVKQFINQFTEQEEKEYNK